MRSPLKDMFKCKGCGARLKKTSAYQHYASRCTSIRPDKQHLKTWVLTKDAFLINNARRGAPNAPLPVCWPMYPFTLSVLPSDVSHTESPTMDTCLMNSNSRHHSFC